MTIYFTEINAPEVKKCFPRFYDGRGRFFEIVYKGQPIGFVGIRPFRDGKEDCELEAFVFQEHRKTLRKSVVLATLGLPNSIGFKRCWMKTAKKSIIKLLKAMERSNKYGVTYVGTTHHKDLFRKELA